MKQNTTWLLDKATQQFPFKKFLIEQKTNKTNKMFFSG